jgi:methylglutaconyl-CoA hydratase
MADLSSPLASVERRGPAVVVTLNRPEKRNALSTALIASVSSALDRAAAEPGARAVVITGAGTAFCAGMDLDEISNETVERAGGAAGKLLELLRKLHALPLPTIAAVNGAAVAGGAGIASACDFVIVARGAKVGYPEVRRGLVAAMVMTFLVRQVGDRDARRLMLTGELIDAAEAVRIGWATESVHPPQMWSRVDDLVGSLIQAGPEALAGTKRFFDELGHSPLSEELQMSRERHLTARLSDEAREGTAAFREKRLPRWAR